MKWLRTIVLVNKGGVIASDDWKSHHEAYVRGIKSIDNPKGSGTLKLRPKVKDGVTASGNVKWKRNGVGYLKTRFADHMTKREGWGAEKNFDFNEKITAPELTLFPGNEAYKEPIAATFSGFDLVQTGKDGERVAVEWETGNISSSHRSLNKLGVALANGVIEAGVLIVPSRALYEHLTDRIGNIAELSHYLDVWGGLESSIERGLLAITVVEHDEIVDKDNDSIKYLKMGEDGRAKEAKKKAKRAK